jgi:hypothetical protein
MRDFLSSGQVSDLRAVSSCVWTLARPPQQDPPAVSRICKGSYTSTTASLELQVLEGIVPCHDLLIDEPVTGVHQVER